MIDYYSGSRAITGLANYRFSSRMGSEGWTAIIWDEDDLRLFPESSYSDRSGARLAPSCAIIEESGSLCGGHSRPIDILLPIMTSAPIGFTRDRWKTCVRIMRISARVGGKRPTGGQLGQRTALMRHSSGVHWKGEKCVPVPGLGFRRGSYKCECRDGYYFPDTDIPEVYRYYNGVDIETEYEKMMRKEDHIYDLSFVCKACAPGCGTCTDGSPCILTLDWIQRSIVLGVNSVIMCFIPVLVWFTWKYRDVKVLKAASPMLLRTILLGATLLYAPMIVQYFDATDITCCMRTWFREIGFSISYGALLLKTWRISVVFRVRSAQRIKISDTDLIKRLVLIVLLFAAYLSVRMVVGRPHIVKGTHSTGLHTFQCSWDVWDYCAAIAELCLLLWGIRLCIVVRKAPSEFNESRFISWAIYNETLLSLFLNITMFFLQSPANPDLLYLVLFIHTQLTTTVTLAFLFGSKAYVVFKGSAKDQPQTTISRGSKYIAAPKTATTTLGSSQTRDDACMGERLCEDLVDCGNATIEKDIQDEFKRLYMQLETLKQKNMKLGNPHLTVKLSAMTEAAMKTEPADCCTPPAHSPNMNGKRVVINLDNFKDATSL
ncbi:hypothetical protein LSH36_312g01017 [Paralvinella palmiformis]|uniref:G-protein coupled receptors family 3 profile domain-containing protein n=1 Tax=Paralvinella palmiformis TaxID=53620 RepID=A0AAD9N3J7_9ANNE|nr:hypothetical protein LSH36_312g01017 [Paralvinella palmiformis]